MSDEASGMVLKSSVARETKLNEFLESVNSWSGDAIFSKKELFPYFHVFINCSGKCGSMSLTKSFENLNLNVLHVHSTYNFLKMIVRENEPYSNFSIVDYFKLSAEKLQRKVWVFDVVREPISRRISSFFQHFEDGLIDESDTLFNKKIGRDEVLKYYFTNIDQLIELFNRKYLTRLEAYQSFNEWVHDGVDILNSSFVNSNYKYISIDKGDVQYVVLRFKDIQFWEKIIRSLGFSDFKLLSDNLTHKKKHFNIVEKFKKHYYVPSSLIEFVYNIENKSLLGHFFDQNELREYYSSWKIRDVGMEDFILPNDFNGEKYIELHNDLTRVYMAKKSFSFVRCKNTWGAYHYLMHGKKEGRGYK